MAIMYSTTHEFTKSLQVAPEDVIWQLWDMCILFSANVSQPCVEIRGEERAGRDQEEFEHIAMWAGWTASTVRVTVITSFW